VAGEEPRRLKRGVLLGAVAVLVVVVVAVVVVVVQVRRVDRTAEALCARLTEAQDLDQSFTTLDPATLEPQLAALERAKEVAPADIQSEVTTLADFVDEIAAQVAEATNDRDDALSSALGARQDQIDAVTAAGQDVQAWAQMNCGLSLTGPTPTDPAATD
jgi:fumarylacetoacetate (FAA) hydrolase family protein